jgi:hypothetical protein
MMKMRFALTSAALALLGATTSLAAISKAAEAQAVVGGYYYPPSPVYVAPPPAYVYPPAYYYPAPTYYYPPPPPAYYYPPPAYYSRPSYWAPGISATFVFGSRHRWHHH